MDERGTTGALTLYVCHGDDGGPRIHPCRRVQEALRAKGLEYEKVIASHGNPIPFLRKGSRDELRCDRSDEAAGAQAERRDGAHALASHPVVDRPAAVMPAVWVGVSRPLCRR